MQVLKNETLIVSWTFKRITAVDLLPSVESFNSRDGLISSEF